MNPQIKSAAVIFILLVVLQPVYTQENDTLIDRSVVDSLHETTMDQIGQLEKKYNTLLHNAGMKIDAQQKMLDTLSAVLKRREEGMAELNAYTRELEQNLEETAQIAWTNKYVISEERRKIRQVAYIAGPALLGLILISTAICFLLLARLSAQTDRKIIALRKYTHQDLEETRDALWGKFRKRLKKLRSAERKDKKKEESKKKEGKKNRSKKKQR
ncbi:MAG: hypothetical protein K9G38_07420 [Bacteroidales bacterium]|nr:hypothetical protein [Bacteroidales bacterium]